MTARSLHAVPTAARVKGAAVKPDLAPKRIPALLEREHVCQQLLDTVSRASEGSGACVLLGGEAGVGKTSVLTWLEAAVAGDARVLWGACEALDTPRPMGPLHDMAHELGASLIGLLRAGATQAAVFDALIESLRGEALPTVLLFEDVHWADHGTLDLIRFLGRRVTRLPVALVLTYRNDEVGNTHPLRAVMGDLPTQSTLRVSLDLLSPSAVASLAAKAGVSLATLHAITGGNPMFVTEVLAGLESGHAGGVPQTIRDAVLARANRLPIAPREALDLASVVPGKIERALVARILGEPAEAAITDCLTRGLLIETEGGEALMFRHELARLATEAALSNQAKHGLHQRLLDAQIDRPGVSAARLMHHALFLGDTAKVLALAKRAAEDAAKLGAHREAALNFATALGVADAEPDPVRAELYESFSYEHGLIAVDETAITAREHALALWRKCGNHEKVGLNLRWLSRLVWYGADGSKAERLLDEAIAVLQNIAPCAEAAWASSVRSQRYMLHGQVDEAIQWGERALTLATDLNVPEVRVHALNNIGSAMLMSGQDGALTRMEESLRLALAGGFHEQAARVYTNVAVYGERWNFAVAEAYALEGLKFDRSHDLDSWTHYLAGVLAQMRLHQGELEEAEAIARDVLLQPQLATVMRLPALGALGHAQLRLGRADSDTQLAEGLALARPTREAERICPFVAALAESAWLRDDRGGVEAALAALEGLPGAKTNPWDFGDCVVWRHRMGADCSALIAHVAPPHAAEMRGKIKEAATLWTAMGDPHSAAMALAHGSQAQWHEAIEIFATIGAEPAITRLRNRARAAGVRGLRRGPYAKSKQNEFALTAKELDVLRLVIAGKTNVEISEILVRSHRTVEHHVSSVLAKLNARNRADAVLIAADKKLFADATQPETRAE